MQLKNTSALFMLLAAATVSPTQANEGEKWEPVEVEGKPYKVSIDSARFVRNGEAVDAWVRINYKEKKVIPFLNVEYDQLDRFYYFKCDGKKVVVAKSLFLKDGKVVQTFDATKAQPFMGTSPMQPQDVSAGSIEDEAFQIACKYKKK